MEALSAPAHPSNKAHQKIITLVPQGIYRAYDGDLYFVLGIERERGGWSHGEEYFVRAIEVRNHHEGLVLSWRLVRMGSSSHKAWFFRAKLHGKLVPRFKFIRQIKFSKLVEQALQ